MKYVLIALAVAEIVGFVPQTANAGTRCRYYRGGSLRWTQRSAYGLYGAPPMAAIRGWQRARRHPIFGPHYLVK
ncbi:MAG TPA: hypothetical protein VE641_10050 [Chthoniobacterales bacterium]|nr:hypothetical protein [Chthoniobacterales bacterium]